jgi:hypothetical protein
MKFDYFDLLGVSKLFEFKLKLNINDLLTQKIKVLFLF